MADLAQQIVEDIQRQQEMPEGVSFYVVNTATEAQAREVGPLLAERLQPDRRWGRVLHVETVQFGGDVWEVVVEDRGAR